MTDRQKKGVAFLATAGVFGLGGAILLLFANTPAFVPVLIDAAVAVLAIFGIAVVAKPDV